MPKKKDPKKGAKKATPSIARSDDGTIQITFSIAFDQIKKAREEVVKELAKDAEVAGFRKGKAPLDKVLESIPQATLAEKALSRILPKIFADIISENKIKPAMFPKFELLTSEEGKDWQVRTTTCEIPEIKLGDYKSKIAGIAKAKSIWTPDKGKEDVEDEKRQVTREEKEQEVLKVLLTSIKVEIPKILITEDASSRLSQLLQRLEKLGLTLESYLASIGKTSEVLRKEYEEQSRQSIALDLILTEIAKKEQIKVEKSQIEAAVKAAGTDPKLKQRLDTPEQRAMIEAVLKKRAVLDSLIALI